MEMGLLVGTPVELVRFAPLGDPVEIKVRGYHLTLRKHEAEQILVQANALGPEETSSNAPGAAVLPAEVPRPAHRRQVPRPQPPGSRARHRCRTSS